jgi:hypothetical protein
VSDLNQEDVEDIGEREVPAARAGMKFSSRSNVPLLSRFCACRLATGSGIGRRMIVHYNACP